MLLVYQPRESQNHSENESLIDGGIDLDRVPEAMCARLLPPDIVADIRAHLQPDVSTVKRLMLFDRLGWQAGSEPVQGELLPEESGFSRLCRRRSLLARAWFLCGLSEVLDEEAFISLARDAFYKGDLNGSIAVLETCPYFRHQEAFLDDAVDALRTNSSEVFAALALDNPYPARYFSEEAFNQMVLKALFLDLDTSRIIGLADRVNPHLFGMVDDYREELTLARRPLPGGMSWIHKIKNGEADHGLL